MHGSVVHETARYSNPTFTLATFTQKTFIPGDICPDIYYARDLVEVEVANGFGVRFRVRVRIEYSVWSRVEFRYSLSVGN